MAAIIQLRRGTAAAWTAANPILAEGEIGYETNTALQKIGDGITQWNSLAYALELLSNKDTDATFAANSDTKYASQKAVKTYVDGATARNTHAASSKATPVDADEIPLADSAAAFILKKFTWANLKALFTSLTSTAAQEGPTLGAELAISGGWTSAGWTGSYGGGFTHTPGNTSVLSQAVPITISTAYAIGFTISGRTAGKVSVAIGGASAVGGSQHQYPDAVDGAYPSTAFFAGITTLDNTTALTFTPTSTFDGTITLISVKPITAPTAATTSLTNSVGALVSQVRSTPTDLGSMYYGALAGEYSLGGALYNTAFGNGAMQFNTGGQKSCAFGYRALWTNTQGVVNTAIGAFALTSNVIGDQNTGVGYGALYSNISGYNNFAGGVEALSSNTTGSYNVAIGGYDAMLLNTTGSYNVAVGFMALYANVTGSKNAAFGNGAMQNSTVDGNTGIGFFALNQNQTGLRNVAVGYQAGDNVTASDNTFVGYNAGFNTTGVLGLNSALGSLALFSMVANGYGTAVGGQALQLATGRANTALGTWAGKAITTGRANTIIGAFCEAPSATVDGQINIGCVIFGKGAYDGGGAGATQNTFNTGATAGVGTNAPTSTWHVAGSFARNTPTTVAAGTYTVLLTDAHIIANNAGTVTLTLPSAASFVGRELTVRTIQAQTVVSASSNVVPLAGGSAGTAILAGVAGKWAVLVSDGSNWQMQMAA